MTEVLLKEVTVEGKDSKYFVKMNYYFPVACETALNSFKEAFKVKFNSKLLEQQLVDEGTATICIGGKKECQLMSHGYGPCDCCKVSLGRTNE